MPELGEVEYYRKQWNCGLGQTVRAVRLRAASRVFRGADTALLQSALPGAVLLESQARGKQILFRFSGPGWLGLHLGMTGRLEAAGPDFVPGRHDHLTLRLDHCSLVFTDLRQFGRVRFEPGPAAPAWWCQLPADLTSTMFTVRRLRDFLERHRRLPLKAALLLQDGFPGVGNWMADEILWRSRLHPRTVTGQLRDPQLRTLWRAVRFVCRESVRRIGGDFSDPPRAWFYHQRWRGGGRCPRDGSLVLRETIGGRTTAWCPRCQRGLPRRLGPA